MQRTGRINQPSYRIIVTEHARSPKTGNFVEQVGTYNPESKQRNLKEDRIQYWMSVGAQPSITVHNMLVSLNLLKAKKKNALPKKTVAKPAPTEASGKEVPAEAKEEAPTAEEKAAEAQA